MLAAIAAVPRHLFVPEALSRFAWENTALPIGAGQTISQPVVVARMCELLELTRRRAGARRRHRLRAITRPSWPTSRARCGASSASRELAEQARRNLAAAGIENVHVVVGDGSRGLPGAGAVRRDQRRRRRTRRARGAEEQLADGGRLVAPIDGARAAPAAGAPPRATARAHVSGPGALRAARRRRRLDWPRP